MAKPTQYELVSLFYMAKTARVAGTDADILNDVKNKWRKAAALIRALPDSRGFEMTSAEQSADDSNKAAMKAAQDAALVTILKQELIAEQNGFNRPNVIQAIQNDIIAHGG